MSIFSKKPKRVYLDYAAAAPIRDEVKSILIESLMLFGNPGTLHKDGVLAKQALEKSREIFANAIFCRPKEIVFTSSATESNNLAVRGVWSKWQKNNPEKMAHIVATNIEHPSVLEMYKKFEKEKIAEVSYLSVDEDGLVDIKKLREVLRPETILVSVIFASNEIGTIQPIKEIAKEIRHFKKYVLENHESVYPLLHTDASQTPIYEELDMRNLHVDLMTLSAEKIYGLHGVGALFVRSGTPIEKILEGGSQENNLRPGTENIPSIAGFAEAMRLAVNEREVESARVKALQDHSFKKLEENFKEKFIVNGSREQRLPNNINITFKDFDSELLVIELDAKGISVSEKSACNTEDAAESYVIDALRSASQNKQSLRISLGMHTKKEDIDYLIKCLQEIFSKYKNISK